MTAVSAFGVKGVRELKAMEPPSNTRAGLPYSDVQQFAESLLSGQWDRDQEIRFRQQRTGRRRHSVSFQTPPRIDRNTREPGSTDAAKEGMEQEGAFIPRTSPSPISPSSRHTATSATTQRPSSPLSTSNLPPTAGASNSSKRHSFSVSDLLAIERQKRQALQQGQTPVPTTQILSNDEAEADRPPTPPLEPKEDEQEEKKSPSISPLRSTVVQEKLREGFAAVTKDLDSLSETWSNGETLEDHYSHIGGVAQSIGKYAIQQVTLAIEFANGLEDPVEKEEVIKCSDELKRRTQELLLAIKFFIATKDLAQKPKIAELSHVVKNCHLKIVQKTKVSAPEDKKGTNLNRPGRKNRSLSDFRGSAFFEQQGIDYASIKRQQLEKYQEQCSQSRNQVNASPTASFPEVSKGHMDVSDTKASPPSRRSFLRSGSFSLRRKKDVTLQDLVGGIKDEPKTKITSPTKAESIQPEIPPSVARRQLLQRRNSFSNLFKQKEVTGQLEELRQMAEKEDKNISKMKRRSSISLFFKRDEAKEESLNTLPDPQVTSSSKENGKYGSIRGFFGLGKSQPIHQQSRLQEQEKGDTNQTTETNSKKSTMDAFDGLLAEMHAMGEKCYGCELVIMDSESAVMAFNRRWHPQCLSCRVCSKVFFDSALTMVEASDGWAYCEEDYKKEFPNCSKCTTQIVDKEEKIEALGTFWHSNCFVCAFCEKPFRGLKFYQHNGLPYCEAHYYHIFGMLCNDCFKPILGGKCMNANGLRYHMEHFTCSHCKSLLSHQIYYTKFQKIFCKQCYLAFYG